MQTRNKSFLLRLTEQEYATLKRKSELAGLKMNPFLVSLINGREIHPRTPDSCKALARQVAAVGNNLNQLARIANFNGKAEDAYLQEAQQIPYPRRFRLTEKTQKPAARRPIRC